MNRPALIRIRGQRAEFQRVQRLSRIPSARIRKKSFRILIQTNMQPRKATLPVRHRPIQKDADIVRGQWFQLENDGA